MKNMEGGGYSSPCCDGARAQAQPYKRIYICSPYADDPEANRMRARSHALEVLKQGNHPVVPHYCFEYLSGYEIERPIVLYLCCREIETCDEVWVYGEPSDGMAFEIAYARGVGKPVTFIGGAARERRIARTGDVGTGI